MLIKYMFMVPLYLQAVRGDSPSAAGVRLMIPSLATPVGGVIAGSLMHRGYRLAYNVRFGTAMMLLGNILAWSMGTTGARWKEFIYLVPANMGLGLTNPSVLFSFISLCEQKGKFPSPSSELSNAPKLTFLLRASCGYLDCVPDSVHGHHLWRDNNDGYCAERPDSETAPDSGAGCD